MKNRNVITLLLGGLFGESKSTYQRFFFVCFFLVTTEMERGDEAFF